MAQTVLEAMRAGSPVVLGTMTFGSPVGRQDAEELVWHALRSGVRMIDTANMYEGYQRYAGSAGGVAEEILGGALRGRRGEALIATKLGMKVGETPEDEGTSAAAIRKQLPQSLARLETDYVDVYYLHRPDAAELLEDTLLELGRAIREGAIRSYGVSNYSADQFRTLLDTARALGAPLPMFCQPPLSLLRQEACEALLPLCRREGVAVIPYQIYQGGLLTGKYTRGGEVPQGSRGAEKPDWMWEMNDALFDRLEAYESAAQRRGMPLKGYALCWTLSQPAVAGAIVGVKNRAQLDEAVQAAASCQ